MTRWCPFYNLIDKYATSPDERLKLTDKFFASLRLSLACVMTPAQPWLKAVREGVGQRQIGFRSADLVLT